MIRAKGGKRQPRYHQLKDAAATRLCGLLEYKSNKEEVKPRTMAEMSEEVENAMFSLRIQLWAGV
jgi:hypothetical protein